MLKSIKNIDKKRSLEILTSLINKNLPSPFDLNNSIGGKDDDPISTLIIQEISDRIKKYSRNELTINSAILSELSNEIAEISLKGKDLALLKKQAGSLGVLSNIFYTPIFQPTYKNEIEKYGIRKNQIEEILIRPDVVHEIEYGEGNNIAIFLKNIESRTNVSQVIVIVQRNQDTLIVSNAWRYYSNVYNFNVAETLNNFVQKYGLNVKLNNEVRILFINYEVPLSKDVFNNDILRFEVLAGGVQNHTTAFNYRKNENENKLLISYLFAINNEKYFEDIKTYQK
ncbi:MAG: hypothetical protein P4L35_19535 [Ignavibacteriaceae bacterium]|nr:hypothetical protein [Ignavibacteriaceae bacterium]